MARSLRGLQRGIVGGVLAVLLGWPLPGVASTILLSQVSSDETPAEALFAELHFDVVGAVLSQTLVLKLLNRTDESNLQFGTGEYKITAIYFNVNDASNLTGLTLLSPSGWSLETNQRGGGEFGRFDYALIGDLGRPPHQAIDAGASLTFELAITASGEVFMEDFATELSRTPPGSMPQIAQAKFVQGPLDDSAFGGSSHVVPEPGAALLVTAGLLGAVLRRRPG